MPVGLSEGRKGEKELEINLFYLLLLLLFILTLYKLL